VQKAVETGAQGQPLAASPGYLGTLKNNGVSIAPYHDFDAKVDPTLKTEVEALKQQIIAGTVKVQSANAPQ
jgi:basic membrane protein A